MSRKRIGVLLAEEFPPEIHETVGTVAGAYRAMLDPDFDVDFWRVEHGEFPDTVNECDGWFISGSAASAYDQNDWVLRLRNFVIVAAGKRPMVGVCFGHQIIADTLGGKVEKWHAGRVWGVHDYETVACEPWMQAATTQCVAVAHGDQVTRVPPRARLISRCDWTPNAALYYPEERILTVQCHPELTLDIRRRYIAIRRGTLFTDEEAEHRLGQCDTTLEVTAMRQWINEILEDRTAA